MKIFKLSTGAATAPDDLKSSTVGGLDSVLAGVDVDLRAQGPRLWLPDCDTRLGGARPQSESWVSDSDKGPWASDPDRDSRAPRL